MNKMETERWKKLEAIYHSALAIEPIEREEFLQNICGDDAEMLNEAKKLLNSNLPTEEFLQDNAFEIGIKILEKNMSDTITDKFPTNIEDKTPNLIGGRYELLIPIGEGGIGEVYLANDTTLNRKVVVKFLQNNTTNNWIIEKFKDEAVVQSQVSHPNVAVAFDKGVLEKERVTILEYKGKSEYRKLAKDSLYLVMEFIDGSNVSEIITQFQKDNEQIPFDLMAKIISQAGSGVDAIHQAKLVHRDLKPANLMMSKKGLLKVIDFGIARDLTKGTSLIPVGTPSYMPIEQLNRQEVSSATDVFALGVIAYQLITLRVPFVGNDGLSHIRSRQEGVKILPSVLRPDLLKEAETLILQALEYDAAKRPSSAKEFGDKLAEILTRKPEKTPVVQPNYFKPLFAVASLAVLILAIMAGWMWYSLNSHSLRVQTVERAIENGEYETQPSFPTVLSPQGTNYASIGVNVWRTRPVDSTRDSDDVARDTIEVNDSTGNKTEESSAERIGDYIADEQKIYLGIESLTENFLPNKGGYLYVISREQFADGTFGKVWLLFPNAKTFNGDNLIKTDQPIVLPHQKGRVYQINQSPNQVAETYTIIISPWKFWLPKELEERRTELPKELFADWERQFSESAYRASLRGGVGKPRTKREQKVGSRETIETDDPLTKDDPLPQTVYKSAVKVGNPAMFTVALRFKD